MMQGRKNIKKYILYVFRQVWKEETIRRD